MKFVGYSKTFSTKDQMQYESIGEFWDAMSVVYGRENLRGLGYNWGDSSIEYVIGLKNGDINQDIVIDELVYKEINLPDEGWITYEGRAEDLSEIYNEIYKNGVLTYEIEQFWNDGKCKIMIYRE